MSPLQEIYAECYLDKSRVKFIEKFFSTYDGTVGRNAQFLLFPRQKAFLQGLGTFNDLIAIKHRQAGITTISAAWIAAQCAFASPESPETILCIANTRGLAEEMLEKIIGFLEQVPRWVWGPDYYHPDPKNPKNLKSIFTRSNKSEFKLFNGCAAYARSAKKNAARGIPSVSILVMDEAAHIEDGNTVFASARSAQNAVSNEKRKTILISTPFGKDSLYYRTYSQAQMHLNDFHIVDFRWWQDLRYNRFLKWYRKNETTGDDEWIEEPVLDKMGNIPYDEKKWEKLKADGWNPTSPWFETTCRSLLNDRQMIAQEIEVSFLGSADTVVAPEVIEFQRDTNVIEITPRWPLKDPIVTETWIWEDPIPGHRYVMAIDPSSGASDDNTSLQILDIDAIDENGLPYINQVLEYYGKRIGTEVAVMADRYGRIYNNALIVVECIGGYGDAVVLALASMKYPNLYYDEAALKTYTINDPNRRFKNDDTGKLPGFRTNTVREQMLANFAASVTNNSLKLRSMRVINEMDTWVWKNGRPDHMKGFHDDTITCLAMGLFVIKYYIFKKLQDTAKDKKILHSWRSSNSVTVRERDDSRQTKHNLPIYSSYRMQQNREQRTRAMIMLGGFKPKK